MHGKPHVVLSGQAFIRAILRAIPVAWPFTDSPVHVGRAGVPVRESRKESLLSYLTGSFPSTVWKGPLREVVQQ